MLARSRQPLTSGIPSLTPEQQERNARVMDERHGKMLLHTEISLLSLLAGVEGVVRMRDVFVDVCEHEQVRKKKSYQEDC